MNQYVEMTIRPPRRGGQGFRALCWCNIVFCAAIVVVCVFALAKFGANLPLLGLMALALGLGIGSFFIRSNLDVEYDLILVEDELRCDKITGAARRRQLFRVPLASIEAFGQVDRAYLNFAQDRAVKEYLLAFGKDDQLSYAVFKNEGKTCLLTFAPSQEMEVAMARAARSGRR